MSRASRARYWRKRSRAARITQPPTFDPLTTRITWGKYCQDRTAGMFWAHLPDDYLEWVVREVKNKDEREKARLTLEYLKAKGTI